MLTQEPVQAAVWHCLNHYAYSDAIFLAERLYAEVNTDEALFCICHVPSDIRRRTRLFTSSNTNGTSSSVKENNKSQS